MPDRPVVAVPRLTIAPHAMFREAQRHLRGTTQDAGTSLANRKSILRTRVARCHVGTDRQRGLSVPVNGDLWRS